MVAKLVMDKCTETSNAGGMITATFDYTLIDHDEKVHFVNRLKECG